MSIEFIVIFLAFLCAGFVHTTVGFGGALVVMPTITLVIAVQQATPLQAITGLVLTPVLLYRYRAAWLWREALPMIATSVIAVPIGAYALVQLPERFVVGCLAFVLLGYVAFVWLARFTPKPMTESKRIHPGAFVAGFFSGLLGGAYATNGPPLIIYGNLRGWDKDAFRSILQSVFLVNGTFIALWLALQGLVTREVGLYALAAFPGLALGMGGGFLVDPYINHDRFRRVVLGLLFVLGLMLLVRTVRG